MVTIKQELNYSWWLLRLLYGITFIGAGVDKFFGLVTSWHQFVSPAVIQFTGLPVGIIVIAMGLVEIGIGVLIFTRWVKITALLIALWMIANGCYLFYFHMFLDTAARYCTLGIIGLVFFHLTRVREKLMQQ